MKHLVLLGAGHAHLEVLRNFVLNPLPHTRVTLVSPQAQQLYSGMLPGWVAGHYDLDACCIPIAPLLADSGVQWVQASVVAVNARAQLLSLSNGESLDYDVLSINTGATLSPSALAGAAAHALCLRPLDAFVTQLPAVLALKPARITVIGGGAAGVELALALKYRLPQASVTLVAGATLLASHNSHVQRAVAAALKGAGVETYLEAAQSVDAHSVTLASGNRIDSDLNLLALGAQPAAWCAGSGLALCPRGFIATNAYQASTSHANVFVVGDAASRVDNTAQAKSGVYSVRSAAPLLANLRAILAGQALKTYYPKPKSLNLLALGDQRAVASWGSVCIQGAWVWRLKDWIDRRFIAKYR